MSRIKALHSAGENAGIVQLRLLLESLFQPDLSENELVERVDESANQGIALLRSAEFTSGGTYFNCF